MNKNSCYNENELDIENLKSIEDLPLFLTVSDISRIMGIGLNKAYDLFHSENFPSIRLGKRMVISKNAFVKWADNPLI